MHAQSKRELDLLSTRLSQVQRDYERARSRGDAERVYRFRLQISAMMTERDRLVRNLSKSVPTMSPPAVASPSGQ
jgi:hypothetical protein